MSNLARMDAVKTLNEDFLSCNICSEVFKDPCTIGCGHTFCRQCLTTFTKTRRDAITAKSILCPMCRQMSKVPNPNKPVDKWSNQFKPSFLMQGLLDKFALPETTSEVQKEIYCLSCEQVGKSSVASSRCQNCEKLLCDKCKQTHRMADHVISSLNTKDEDIQKQRSICKEHDTVIEFFCKDCNKAICHKCCIVYHRKCDSVVTLDSMLPEMKRDLLTSEEIIQGRLKDMKSHIHQYQSQMVNILQMKTMAGNNIRATSQRAIDLIKMKENILLVKLDDLAKKQTDQLTKQTTTNEKDLKRFQQHLESINKAIQSGNALDMYEMYQLCQSGAITADVNLSQLPKSNLLFVDDLDESKFIRNVALGDVISVSDTIQVYKTSLESMTGIRTIHDKDRPDANGVPVLIEDGLEVMVVTDYNNSSVKSFWTKNKRSYSSSQNLNCTPSGVEKLTDRKIVISFEHNMFVIASVTPTIMIESTITTEKIYGYLTAINCSLLAATSWDLMVRNGDDSPYSNGIDILDLAGNVLRTVAESGLGWPGYISITNKGNMLIADGLSVLCLAQTGKLIFKYSPPGDSMLTGPRGITTTKYGDILVTDVYTNRVLQLTELGEYVKTILTADDVDSPQGIHCVNDKLYVTQKAGNVKTFSLVLQK